MTRGRRVLKLSSSRPPVEHSTRDLMRKQPFTRAWARLVASGAAVVLFGDITTEAEGHGPREDRPN